ncbi:MAG: hypothetical protein JO042_06030 [Sinobacteraceae bacterium]|nr:hypothetical protein [Nevskiaceae bacterium]
MTSLNTRYLVDASQMPEKLIELPGNHAVHVTVLLDGSDGGPEASRGRFTDGFETFAHFHLGAQFQVLFEGSLEFPDFTLTAPAVHYTDHHVAYGPFTARGKHDMYVLHAKPAGIVNFNEDRSRLKEIDQDGREIVCSAQDVAYTPLPEQPAVKCKHLIPAGRGPTAKLLRYPPGASLAPTFSEFGRYELVYTGSMIVTGSMGVGNRSLGRGGLQFVAAGTTGAALTAGSDGLELIVLEFDENAEVSFGGNNFDALEMAGQQLEKQRRA